MATPTPIPHASPSHSAAALRSNSNGVASASPITVNTNARSPPSPPLVSPLLSRSPFATLSGASRGGARSSGTAVGAAFAPSSYSSSNGDEREPTTPRTTDFSTSPFSNGGSGSAGMGAPLGRVPSFPLSGSYDGVALGRGWASQGSIIGFGARPPPEKEHKAMGLLRRFSIGAASSAPATGTPPAGSAAPSARSAALATSVDQQQSAPVVQRHSRSFSAASISSTSFDVVCLSSPSPGVAAPVSPNDEPRKMRGRQGSLGGNTKRRPSPMGERLLMGHFNAH